MIEGRPSQMKIRLNGPNGGAPSPIMMPPRLDSQCSQISVGIPARTNASGRTTTSRRGRARSPVDYNRRHKDPSSAAAAAAAVAKTIQDQQAPWFNNNNFEQCNDSKHHREEHPYPVNFDHQNSFDIPNSFSFSRNDLERNDSLRTSNVGNRHRYGRNVHQPSQRPESRQQNSLDQNVRRSHSGLSSVFRGRPRQNPKPSDQQEILFSLRSQSASFEDSKEPFYRSNMQPPLSPEEPPRIQNSHHQNKMSSNNFFFEPQRSHRSSSENNYSKRHPPVQQTASGFDIGPSLSLLNHSFESFGAPERDDSFGVPLSGDGGSNQQRVTMSRTHSYPNKNSPERDANFSKNIASPSKMFMSSSPTDIGHSNSMMLDFEPSSSFGPPIPRDNISPQKNKYGIENTMVLGRESCITDRHVSTSRQTNGHKNHQQPFGQRVTDQIKTVPSHIGSGVSHDMRVERSTQLELSHRERSAPEINPLLPPSPHCEPVSYYTVLLLNKEAFSQCQFLLPRLKKAMSTDKTPVLVTPPKHITGSKNATPKRRKDDHEVSQETPPHILVKNNRNLSMPQVSYSPDTQSSSGRKELSLPKDIEISRRRVVSAICAFGGNIERKVQADTPNTKSETNESIFRIKEEDDKETDPSTLYKDKLSSRFRDLESRLTWNNEDSPPVTISDDDLKSIEPPKTTSMFPGDATGKTASSDDLSPSAHKRQKSEITSDSDHASLSSREEIESPSTGKSRKDKHDGNSKQGDRGGDQPKMRYRCKLCGQPKQNHTCPYQQSLQRNIGVTVYPAVNAFTACEPGHLALALSEMNNFVTETASVESTPSRISPDRPMMVMPPQLNGSMAMSYNIPPQVSPDLRNVSSPQYRTPFRNSPRNIPGVISTSSNFHSVEKKSVIATPARTMKRKRSLKQDDNSHDSFSSANDLLFVDGTELCPEQYRIVSSKKTTGSYSYPALPLPYGQRKRLSENLFALSKDIPNLTDDCAHILRDAREQDKWDTAVAELTTQVVVMKHCKEGDTCLEGLRKYLLTLGFAC